MAQTKPNEPIHEAKPQSYDAMQWYEVWLQVFTQPGVETFERIIHNSNASAQNGYRWVFIAGIIGIAVSSLFTSDTLAAYLAAVTVAPLIVGALFLIAFVTNSWITQELARRLGGKGDFGVYHYAAAAFSAPLFLVASLTVPFATVSTFAVNAVTFALLITQFIMTSFAIRAVNGFSWSEAAGVIFAVIGVQFGAIFILVLLTSIGAGV